MYTRKLYKAIPRINRKDFPKDLKVDFEVGKIYPLWINDKEDDTHCLKIFERKNNSIVYEEQWGDHIRKNRRLSKYTNGEIFFLYDEWSTAGNIIAWPDCFLKEDDNE